MGNHKLEQHQSRVNTTSPIVSEVAIVETQRQHVGVGVTQSLNVGITTIGAEMVLVPNIDVVKRGVLVGFAKRLGSRLSGVPVGRNPSRSSTLPTTTTRVVGIPQMVLTNLLMAIHGNKTIDRPLINSMVVGRCKSANAMYSR